MKAKYLLLPLAFLAVAMVSCGDDDDVRKTSIEKSDVNVNANKSADPSARRWEIPALNNGNDYITHYTGDGELNYALEWNKSANHSQWVAYRYDNYLNKQKVGRSDEWGADPYYNSQPQYQIDIQTFKGYNRGHLVGSAERLYSREANVQTFYMTNMSPMNGNFNSEYWGEIEDRVRDRGRSCSAGDTLYVVKGGTIDDRINGSVSLRTTNGNRIDMVVPKYYYIAVLSLSADGTAKAIGFWMEHKDYANTSSSFLKELRRSSACSVDELEERTGIDFFCNVPDWIENFVEKAYTLSDWNGM